jgi:hypothetical protein
LSRGIIICLIIVLAIVIAFLVIRHRKAEAGKGRFHKSGAQPVRAELRPQTSQAQTSARETDILNETKSIEAATKSIEAANVTLSPDENIAGEVQPKIVVEQNKKVIDQLSVGAQENESSPVGDKDDPSKRIFCLAELHQTLAKCADTVSEPSSYLPTSLQQQNATADVLKRSPM